MREATGGTASRSGDPASTLLRLILGLVSPDSGSIRVDGLPGEPVVRVGSKAFTESFILGKIVADVIERAGEARVERKFGLGDTGITYRAVAHGDIDLYPEYTGPLSQMILGTPSARSVAELRHELRGAGEGWGS